VKEIVLVNGGVALVDDEDFATLNRWKWRRNSSGYAKRDRGRSGPGRDILMHRVILSLVDPRIECDHRDGNGLNNQRMNLRACSHAQNGRNKSKHRNGRHRFKGVCFEPNRRGAKKWRGQVWYVDRLYSSPLFLSDVEAAEWYDATATKLHGEFAKTNRSLGLLPITG
jgi:hypothetical protein